MILKCSPVLRTSAEQLENKQKGGFISRRVIIGVLIALSTALTIWQLNQTPEIVTARALVFARDIGKGEVVEASDFVEAQILPENSVEGMLTSAEEVIGARALLDFPGGMVVTRNFFEQRSEWELDKGHAATAIKMQPDSAVCWITEPGSTLNVCFVDDSGMFTQLGEVKLLEIYDQRLGKDDVPVFAVVSGNQEVIKQIVQRRTLGRLEVLIKK